VYDTFSFPLKPHLLSVVFVACGLWFVSRILSRRLPAWRTLHRTVPDCANYARPALSPEESPAREWADADRKEATALRLLSLAGGPAIPPWRHRQGMGKGVWAWPAIRFVFSLPWR